MNQTITQPYGVKYTSHELQPTANVTVRKNRVKQYGSNIYLKNGTNFELELWNPKSTRVLAKISINGQEVSGGGIVLNPGQRVYIERFIDEDRKFKFVTYEAEDSKEGRNAIRNNGDVSVEFFDETFYLPQQITYDHQQFTYTNDGTAGNPVYGGCFTSNTMDFNDCINIANTVQEPANLFSNSFSRGKSIETGRVEKGEKSNQHFDSTYGEFSIFTCSSYFIKILPKSQQPTNASEIRSYCAQCGRKWKRGENFCPVCGTPNK